MKNVKNLLLLKEKKRLMREYIMYIIKNMLMQIIIIIKIYDENVE